MRAYLFPGQGSQQKGMGAELFDEFSDLVKVADDILGYSIKELCLDDPKNILGNTQYTQPALFFVNSLSYLKTIKDTGKEPDYVAGHSLGEYNALLASGAFDFETGLKLVKKRGELMSEAVGGGMAAVLGLNEDAVLEILKTNSIGGNIDVANYNSPSQLVISGPAIDVERMKPFFEEAGARYIVLKVSGAFHSRYMIESKRRFEKYLEEFKFFKLKIPVISNTFARPYKNNNVVTTLAEQVIKPVKWTESIRYLMGKGVSEFIQIGPGVVLNGLVKNIQKDAEPLIVDEQEDLASDDASVDNFENISATDIQDTSVNNEIIDDSSVLAAMSLGSEEFKKDYGLKYAYLVGGMCKGITSKEMVVKLGKSGMMGFLGTGDMEIEQVDEALRYISKSLPEGSPYGVNITYNPLRSESDKKYFDLLEKYGVRNIEVSSCLNITPELVRFRLKGLKRGDGNSVVAVNKIIAKVSRPEIARLFLSPPPEQIVRSLVAEGVVTQEEAELSRKVPMCNDLCLESGRETDTCLSLIFLPQVLQMRDNLIAEQGLVRKAKVGVAGGLGTPEMAAAAFFAGTDFILTGSINQCSVEAGTSDTAKSILQEVGVFDMSYVPSKDLFEMGVKSQVVKKGMFFPYRANKLFELYNQYNSIEEIDEKNKNQLQAKYFKRSLADIFKDISLTYSHSELKRIEENPKNKMAAVFKWYFNFAFNSAILGNPEHKVDYMLYSSPALGAFNEWVKGTELQDWKSRNVDKIAVKLMTATAEFIKRSNK